MLIAIDGFNAFFNKKTDLKTEDRVLVTPQQVSIVQTGLSAVLSDWVILLKKTFYVYECINIFIYFLQNNGAIVMVTSPRAALNTRRESHLPIYLIGRQVKQYFICYLLFYKTFFQFNL